MTNCTCIECTPDIDEPNDKTMTECEEFDRLIDSIIVAVAELPDRDSPDDWPEAMLVTSGELELILSTKLEAATAKADESHKFFTDCLQNQVEILKEANTEAETEITELREGLHEHIQAIEKQAYAAIERQKQLSAKDELIAQCEEALKAAYPVLQDYSLSNPMHLYKNVWQDPRGVHKALGITNETLAAIANHKKPNQEKEKQYARKRSYEQSRWT